MTRQQAKIAAALMVVVLACVTDGLAQDLTLAGRVAAERAIEQVLWNHRIWPAENSGPKPGLSLILPDALLRARVEDSLRKSNALASWWGRPITAGQLQAEMQRMATSTKDARVLQEIFDALGNDPRVIAETLARGMLADRLLRERYARDEALHMGARKQAERALALCAQAGSDCLRAQGADVHKWQWVIQSEASPLIADRPERVELTRDEFASLRDRLSRELGLNILPVGRRTSLTDEDDAFSVTEIVSSGEREICTVEARWPKREFNTWWESNKNSLRAEVVEPSRAYVAPQIAGGERSALTTGVSEMWTPTTTVGAPGARYRHNAVWTGAEMIVWGGAPYQVSGGRYYPALDGWAPTSTGAGMPSPRAQFPAIWTGTEMIVWGGRSSQGDTDTGGRYNPNTDTWTPTSLIDAPAARSDHTAVWTGSEMIVFGGLNDMALQVQDTGARYNPANESWTVMPLAPHAGVFHTAVWAGDEMIVWGGFGWGLAENSGMRYRPASGTWASMSVTGAPEARGNHSAVWTGTEMIVWGGESSNPTLCFANGGRYDPEADTWAPSSLAAPILSRKYHTAIWTGTEMIVWGGFNACNGSRPPDGAVYDPASDSWRTTTLVGAPPPRNFHAAVWTGSEMIVWGGLFPGALNTGGRYNPCVLSLTSYLDADGDGYGDASSSIRTCDGSIPSGHVTNSNDCNDSSAISHPGAPEVNDGLDNQCPGDSGYGTVDEIAALAGFPDPGNPDLFCWPAQENATMYQIVRSDSPSFPSVCLVVTTAATCDLNPGVPPPGRSYFYLVRAVSPFIGSWGVDGQGNERTNVCGL